MTKNRKPSKGAWAIRRRRQASTMLQSEVLNLITPGHNPEDYPCQTRLQDIWPDQGMSEMGEMLVRATEGRS